MKILLLLFFLYGTLFTNAQSNYHGKIYLEMISYENPTSKKDDGYACDFINSVMNDYCDVVFNMCLTSIRSQGRTIPCDLAKRSTIGQVYDGVTHIKFGDKIGYLKNPIEIPLYDVPESIRFTVNVTDYDITGEELIAQFDHSVRLFIVPNNQTVSQVDAIKLRTRYSQIVFRIYGRCQPDYYGDGCKVFCKPSHNDKTGYYGCDLETGRKYCLNGWTGIDCRQRDECVFNNPCHGSSVCFMKGSQVLCDCPATLKGRYCTEAINPCSKSNPCSNNGVCVMNNTDSTWKCQCPTGFYGKLCEKDINECILNNNNNDADDKLCKNGGLCQNIFGSYKCDCIMNYWGLHCEKPPVYSVYPISNKFFNEKASAHRIFNGTQDKLIIALLILISIMITLVVVGLFIYKCRPKKHSNDSLKNMDINRSVESVYSSCEYDDLKKEKSKEKMITNEDIKSPMILSELNEYEVQGDNYIPQNTRTQLPTLPPVSRDQRQFV